MCNKAVTGTFALSLSPFFIIEVQAQAISEYRYDNNYNSKYPLAYEYDKKKHNYYHQINPPADIVVPIDFPTIQKAIDEANEGDVIKVLPGTYTEQLTISKSLTLIGSGAKSTIIVAPSLEKLKLNIIGFPYIINIDNQAQVTMKGFTIKVIEDTFCDTLLVGTNRLLGISVFGDATLKLY